MNRGVDLEQGRRAPGDAALPSVLLVMGVCGAGKSTIGALLAERLGWDFVDGDDFHPPANLDKLRRAVPLSDRDRRDWLQAIAAWIDATRHAGRHGVVACSALKRSYRAVLAGGRSDVRLVYLRGERALVAERMAARSGHVMPAQLLESQFQALEEPGPDEDPLVVAVEAPPASVVETVLQRLRRQAPR